MGGRESKLSNYDVEYLLQTTSFTRSQIKSWHRGFMVSEISVNHYYTVSRKKATLIFNITISPSVEIPSQFLKHFARE